MRIPRPYSVQSRFLTGMAVITLMMGAIFAVLFYFHVREVLEHEVRDKAELVFFQADAVQNYVRSSLRPKMYEELPDKFVIQAMSSSYISRAVMGQVRQATGGHLYRRVAVNARNENFEANGIERELIEYFRMNEESHLWQGYREIDGQSHFVMARPVRYGQSCMYCHGDPADAPHELTDMYGSRGFGHEVDAVDGLDFVGLPVTGSVAKLKGTIVFYMMLFCGSALVFFGMTNLFFKRLVVNNLRDLTSAFRRNFSDEKGLALVREVESGDEIERMAEGMEKLGDHLFETRQKLQDYAVNLESMVEERTSELEQAIAERQGDVDLFVHLLVGLNRSQGRADLWRQALPVIVDRFGLAGATFYCTFASHRSYTWPEGAEAVPLPEDWVDILTDGQILLREGIAYIPVESAEESPDGILCLRTSPGGGFRERDHRVLRALGRQLGIAAENIAALDNILRHTGNLQSIFEGISDPLLLMDTNGMPLMVNEAARKLSRELSGGGRDDGDILPYLCGEDESFCSLSRVLDTRNYESTQVRTASDRYFNVTMYPVPGGEGGSRAVVSVREITNERKMIAQVTQSEKLATVGKLASGLAHEINNPLGVILCYAELLRDSLGEAGQHEDLDVIVKHTRQAQRVLRDLLDFARPKVATDRETDPVALASSMADLFRVQAEKKGARIVNRCEPLGRTVRVEPQILEQIFANLLLNALDAVDQGRGVIELASDYDETAGEVVLSMSDNGHGIADSDLDHIFEPFFSTKDVDKGSGLGLAVIYGFMRDLGGSIEAENRTAEGVSGAKFILRFPAGGTAGENAAENIQD